MKYRLCGAVLGAILALALAPHAFALSMMCQPNASVQAGPYPSGTTYTVPYDGLVMSVNPNDEQSLEQAGCQTVGAAGLTLIAVLHGANMNVTTDQPLTLLTAPNVGYQPTAVLVRNCSASLTAAQGEFYNTASKGGTAVIGSGTTQAYTGCTGAGTSMLITATTAQIETLQTVAPILSLTTAQGAAATADIYLYGYIYP
jgi:hypothetical protein